VVDGRSIHDRLQAAADRAVPGHWEGDLISGSANTHIATLVERKSRYTVLGKIRGKDTNSVISGILREVGKLPDTLWESITWDRGDEIADHKRLKSKKILMFVSLTHRAHGKEERTKLQIAY
jgi:IS30 family transposase